MVSGQRFCQSGQRGKTWVNYARTSSTQSLRSWLQHIADDENRMIEFKTIEHFKPGIFQEITKRCYEPLFQYCPEKKAEFHQQWEESDKETFDHPAIVKCVFVSCINDKPIGFASWDARKKPIGIIGQNCILQGVTLGVIIFLIFKALNAIAADRVGLDTQILLSVLFPVFLLIVEYLVYSKKEDTFKN
jgi:hypothetical protein